MATSDFSITPQERTFVLNGDLEAFWKSRLNKKTLWQGLGSHFG